MKGLMYLDITVRTDPNTGIVVAENTAILPLRAEADSVSAALAKLAEMAENVQASVRPET